AALQRLDPQIENAAASLGAGQATILRRIVLPQVLPGVLSGAIIVFSLAASAFATPAIIGGRRLKVAATLAYDEFLNTLNWPLGATVATLLLLALVTIIVGCNRLLERRYAEVFRRAAMARWRWLSTAHSWCSCWRRSSLSARWPSRPRAISPFPRKGYRSGG